MPCEPILFGGPKDARRHDLASIGFRDQYVAYAAAPTIVALAPTSTLLQDAGAPWPISTFRFLSIPTAKDGLASTPAHDHLSVISLHPTADLLCVGMECSGLYLTSATDAIFTAETRLPIQLTGEHIHCTCFVGDSRLSLSAEPNGPGNYLVFSSTFSSSDTHLSPHRLTVYSIQQSCKVWCGASEPLQGMCSLLPSFQFAACSKEGLVMVYTLKHQATCSPSVEEDVGSTEEGSMGPSISEKQTSFLCVSRTCSTLEEWGDQPHFISCSAALPESNDDGRKFLALMASGLLVEYDALSGSIHRQMDCRSPQATGVRVFSQLILVYGTAVRYFDRETWEFRGKHMLEVRTWNGKLTSPVSAISVLVFNQSCICFISDGSIFGIKLAKGKTKGKVSDSGQNSMLTFKRIYHYSPLIGSIADSKYEKETSLTRLSWIQPFGDDEFLENTPCVLWCSQGIRLVDGRDLHCASQSPLRFTCGAFLDSYNLLFAQSSQTGQIHVFDAQELWKQKTTLPIDQSIVSLAGNQCGTVVALGENQTLFYMSLQFSIAGAACYRKLVLTHRNREELSGGPFRSIFFVADALYAVASATLMNVDTRAEHHWGEPMLRVDSVGRHQLLVLLFSSRCELFDPHFPNKRRNALSLPFTATAAASLVAEPHDGKFVAVGQNGQVLVFSVTEGGAPLLFVDQHPSSVNVQLPLLGFVGVGKTASHLLVGDSSGMVCFYSLHTRRKIYRRGEESISPSESGFHADPVESALSHSLTPLGDGLTPSSKQLNDRFSELTDFYNSQGLGSVKRRRRSLPSTNALSVPKDHTNPDVLRRSSYDVAQDASGPQPLIIEESPSRPVNREEQDDMDSALTGLCSVIISDLTEVCESGPDPHPLLHMPEAHPIVSKAEAEQSSLIAPKAPASALSVEESNLIHLPNVLKGPTCSTATNLRASLRHLKNLLATAQGTPAVQENSEELIELFEALSITLRSNSISTPSRSLDSFMTNSQVLRSEMVQLQELDQRFAEQSREVFQPQEGGTTEE